MNYKEKYEEAIGKIRNLINSGKKQGDIIVRIDDIENALPEVKEDEDEYVLKSIIGHLRECRNQCRSEVMIGEYATWIAWLEKQEKKAKFIDSIQVGDNVTRTPDGILVNTSELSRITKTDKWDIRDIRTWQYIVSDVLTKKDGIGQYLDCGECRKIAKYMQEEWVKRLE